MSPQHDYIIDNSTGANVRSDINSVLQAIASNNSGSSAPSTTVASQFFADTNAGIMKLRNTSNNGFVNLFTLAGGIDVDAASNFNEDVTFTGASANILFDKSDNALEFADNAKATFGTGGDCEIFHDGSTSRIHSASHNLNIRTPRFAAFNGAGNEDMLKAFENGAVELYFNNVKRFETSSTGVTISGGTVANGHITLPDHTGSQDGKLRFGAGTDLNIYHNGENFIESNNKKLIIRNTSNNIHLQPVSGEGGIDVLPNSAVKLYHDGNQKFETTSEGAKITTDAINTAAILEINSTNGGQPTLSLKASKSGTNRATRIDFLNQDSTTPKWTLLNDFNQNGTNDFRIVDSGQASGNSIIAHQNGSVELYFDNSKKLETTTNGVSVPSGSLRVENGSAFASNSGDAAATFDRTSSTGTLVELRFGGANKGTISVDGSNAAFNVSASDRTLKKNFESWNENVLDLFKNINPQKFNFIDQQDTDVKTKGFVAQDLVESFPEGYTKNKENKYMFNPSGMVVYLMKAIQELEAKVAALEAT